MERKKFFIGVFVLTGLVLGSLFTNAVYKDYLEYGGQMDSLVLSGKGLYISGSSLLPYILFKRGKQYGILFLIGFILKPVVLLYGGLFSLFSGLYPVSPGDEFRNCRPADCDTEPVSALYLLRRVYVSSVPAECKR